MPNQKGEVKILSDHPLVREKISMLRSRNLRPIQFRSILREVSILLCYEATKDLNYEKDGQVETPVKKPTATGEHEEYETGDNWKVTDQIVLVPILRAGLGMVTDIWDLMPASHIWPIGIKREENDNPLVVYYPLSPPGSEPKFEPVEAFKAGVEAFCLILDPTLATGNSAIKAVGILKNSGVRAQRIKFLGLIGAPEGIEALQEAHPEVSIYLAVKDRGLNADNFIVPGLGDTGERLFQTKE